MATTANKTRRFHLDERDTVLRLGPDLCAIESDTAGATCVTLRTASQRVLATITVTPGPHSPLSDDLPRASLERTSYLSDLGWADDAAPLVPAVLYLAARRARILGSTTIATHVEPTSPSFDALHLLRLDRVRSTNSRQARGQRVDIAAHHAAVAAGGIDFASAFAAEVLETFERWLVDLYGRGFFRAVWDRTLRREQYAYTLGHMHQFVRWTTRLLGHAVAQSHDRSLRDHFLSHLQGEVNHELIIERDLAVLGEEVGFVVDDMAATPAIRHFMAVQESLVGLHHDLVLFLASPLAAEGIASHLTPEFLAAMEDNIAAWGVKEPAKAMAFFRSHVSTDGGDDGHWEQVIRMLATQLTSERRLVAFLGILRASTGALTAAYDGFVDDMALFS